MNHHRATNLVSSVEGAGHLGDVMAINGPHIGKTELFEHSAHLGNRKSPHALLEAVEFRRNFPSHKGEMFHAFFHAS